MLALEDNILRGYGQLGQQHWEVWIDHNTEMSLYRFTHSTYNQWTHTNIKQTQSVNKEQVKEMTALVFLFSLWTATSLSDSKDIGGIISSANWVSRNESLTEPSHRILKSICFWRLEVKSQAEQVAVTTASPNGRPSMFPSVHHLKH